MATKNSVPAWRGNVNDFLTYLSLLLREFGIFFYILVRPWTIVGLVFMVSLMLFTQSQSGITRSVMEIVVTLLGGVVGGLITSYLIEYTGNTFLLRKSIGAIRNLQLIKFKVRNVGKRIDELRCTSNVRDFDEIENLIENIHKDTLNSIGDWSDVNPNSETITDFYEVIFTKETAIKNLGREKEILEKQKDNLAHDKTEEISRLEKSISEKNDEISKLNKQIFNLSQSNIGIMSGSLLSTPSVSVVGSINSYFPAKTCGKCGREFQQSTLFIGGPNNLCDMCRVDVDA